MSRLLLLAALAVALTGCASTGVFNAQHLTNVELSEGNYEVVATGVSGEASAGYLIGASAAVGTEMQTLGLIRLSGDGSLYEAAFRDLWATFEAEHGPAEGRSLALVNVRYDSDALNLLVYTRPTIYVRADVVEFVGRE